MIDLQGAELRRSADDRWGPCACTRDGGLVPRGDRDREIGGNDGGQHERCAGAVGEDGDTDGRQDGLAGEVVTGQSWRQRWWRQQRARRVTSARRVTTIGAGAAAKRRRSEALRREEIVWT